MSKMCFQSFGSKDLATTFPSICPFTTSWRVSLHSVIRFVQFGKAQLQVYLSKSHKSQLKLRFSSASMSKHLLTDVHNTVQPIKHMFCWLLLFVETGFSPTNHTTVFTDWLGVVICHPLKYKWHCQYYFYYYSSSTQYADCAHRGVNTLAAKTKFPSSDCKHPQSDKFAPCRRDTFRFTNSMTVQSQQHKLYFHGDSTVKITVCQVFLYFIK